MFLLEKKFEVFKITALAGIFIILFCQCKTLAETPHISEPSPTPEVTLTPDPIPHEHGRPPNAFAATPTPLPPVSNPYTQLFLNVAGSATITSMPFCGDGIKNGIEQCDYNSLSSNCSPGHICTSACTCQAEPTPAPYCGDGIKNGVEQCDFNGTKSSCSGNQICTVSCTCQNTSVEVLNTTTTTATGTPLPQTSLPSAVCGDGIVSNSEECDYNSSLQTCFSSSSCSMTCSCQTVLIPAPAALNTELH